MSIVPNLSISDSSCQNERNQNQLYSWYLLCLGILRNSRTNKQNSRTCWCASTSSTSLSTAQSHWLYHKAPSAPSTTAFPIGIKCDSNQLLSYGCHFLTAYLHLPWQPHASSFPCPSQAFLPCPCASNGTEQAQQAATGR